LSAAALTVGRTERFDPSHFPEAAQPREKFSERRNKTRRSRPFNR
jgi:hypothetical protein